MMQLGFVSAILPEYDLEQVFAVASQCGYDCVEVMCWPPGKAERRYAGVTHIDVTDLSDDRVLEIHALCKKYDVSISALGYYPNPLSPDQDEAQTAIDHLLKLIEAAARLNIGRVTTFVGRDWKKTIDENWPQFERVWGPILDAADKADVRIGIENCPMLFTDEEWPGGKNLAISPAIWRRMFETFPTEQFGLNYDPSHPVFMHMDYLTPMRAFADRLVHVHAKDVRVDQVLLDQVGVFANPNEWHTPKIPGLGQVDWSQFFSVLNDVGYNGPVCVEVEDRAYEGTLENRLRALKQSHNYLRQYLPKM
ncbi:sugar phosphate isomerase/epimerase [Rhodopirellula sp. JC740]|uniref:Sugar phosphate isomerase/epimerase n=1 Tax=Rhodopirellula halodulae TaxID=2894198 RepID=A0ABS8NEH8_9BACT|nr:sugar phosphate isomerase/epimerase family protein [Rhodopirellula sp. JC740]MCC9641954.1 sugar phosphate isomerase/epimerase [Rhodopirellula sp. JC740]